MNSTFLVIPCLTWLACAAPDGPLEATDRLELNVGFDPAVYESIELKHGPDVRVHYDPALWESRSVNRNAEGQAAVSATWKLQGPEWVHVTVTSHPEPIAEAKFKANCFFVQKVRGDPADFVGDQRAWIAEQDWFLLRFRNLHTRPHRSEHHYLLTRDGGHITVLVIGHEATLPRHAATVQALLEGIEVK